MSDKTAEEMFGSPSNEPKPRNTYAEHLDAIEAENRVRPVCQGCQHVFRNDGAGRSRVAVQIKGRGLWHLACYRKVYWGEQ